jgi:hypothetical protein
MRKTKHRRSVSALTERQHLQLLHYALYLRDFEALAGSLWINALRVVHILMKSLILTFSSLWADILAIDLSPGARTNEAWYDLLSSNANVVKCLLSYFCAAAKRASTTSQLIISQIALT